MLIVNFLFCVFALVAAVNFIRNVSQAAGIDGGTQAPDLALVTCASSNTRTEQENLRFNFGIYGFWATGIVLGAVFYVYADESWGGILAVIAGAANIFSIRGILGATRRFMSRYATEHLNQSHDLQDRLPSQEPIALAAEMTAIDAIAAGCIVAPPELSEEMIAAHAQLANACGKQLLAVSNQLKYQNDPEGPTLLVHGDCVFELVDEFDQITRKAYLSATRDGKWFRLVSASGATDKDLGFLTWCHDGGSWSLNAVDQYLA